MDNSIKQKHSINDRVLATPHTTYSLTIMDTNTKVTNSPLASVNPTPVPCGVSSAGQSTVMTPTVHLAQIAHQGHIIVGAGSKQIHSTSAGTVKPAVVDGAPPRFMNAAVPQTRESQTLPRSLEYSTLNPASMYRPVLITHNPAILARLPTPQNEHPYQVVTYPSGQKYCGSLNPTKSVPSGVVLTGLLAMDSVSAESTNATRIAHLLSPAGPPTANTQLLFYCPQNKAVKVSDATKPATTTSTDEHSTQLPTVYYAIASAEVLRQLQSNKNAVGQDLSRKQQLIHTPNGIMLVQSNPPGVTNCVFGQPLLSQKTVPITMATPEPSTLPRSSKAEHGLICTCPPEVNQAILEQQRKRLKNQQHNRVETHDRQPMHYNLASQPASSPQTSPQFVENSDSARDVMGAHNEVDQKLGRVSIFPMNVSGETSSNTGQNPAAAKISVGHSQTIRDRSENDAHTNYLVTLFQALRASGVQPEAFKAAFSRTEILLSNTPPRKQKLVKIKIKECAELREALEELRQTGKMFKAKITEELRQCREVIMRMLAGYQFQNHLPSDSMIRSVRSDRSALDRLIVQLHESQASLVEQLHDLESVIEQTGNDVLQHRCCITLPYVQTLDNRLDSISRAVGSTFVIYPDIRQRLTCQEESEMQAIDKEKSILENQMQQLEEIREKCKRIKGTILTLRRLAIVNVQNRQQSTSPRRFAHLGGAMNRAAADPNSIERNRLYASIRSIKPDSQKRLLAIQRQETLAKQRKRVLAIDVNQNVEQLNEVSSVIMALSSSGRTTKPDKQALASKVELFDFGPKNVGTSRIKVTAHDTSKEAYTIECGSSTRVTDSYPESCDVEDNGVHRPGNLVALCAGVPMIDDTSDSTVESQHCLPPTGILKAKMSQNGLALVTSKSVTKQAMRSGRGVMFNTTVTVDDGSEVVRLNCTLDESELLKHAVPPTEEPAGLSNQSDMRAEQSSGQSMQDNHFFCKKQVNDLCGATEDGLTEQTEFSDLSGNRKLKSVGLNDQQLSKRMINYTEKTSSTNMTVAETNSSIPTPPPRRSSQITNSQAAGSRSFINASSPGPQKKEYENLEFAELKEHSTDPVNRTLPNPCVTTSKESLLSSSK